MSSNKPRAKSDHWGVGGYAILGVGVLTCIFALVQVGRALLVGVIYVPGGRFRPGRDMVFQWDDVGSVVAILLYFFWGLGLPAGILVGLWATRWDKY